jgi:hypothetical protein
LMPQFDIFSFFSQLFWVFFGFITLYLLFSFYLLPSLSAILKVRKRKLSQISGSTELSSAAAASKTVATDPLIFPPYSPISIKLDKLQTVSVKFESLRFLNLDAFSKAQMATILFF